MTPKPNGRKYTLTQVGLAMTAAPIVGVFVIAGLGKLDANVSTTFAAIIPPYYLAVGALVVGFGGANAYVSGKALDAGRTE